MSSGHYNAAADVFSFGVVISEAVAASEGEDIVDDTRTRDFGLDVDKVKALYCTPEELGGDTECDTDGLSMLVSNLIDLGGWCCRLDPGQRPTTDQIEGRLQRIQLEYQAKHLKSASPKPIIETLAVNTATTTTFSVTGESSATGVAPLLPGVSTTVSTTPTSVSSLSPSKTATTTTTSSSTTVSLHETRLTSIISNDQEEELGGIEVIVPMPTVDPTVDPMIREAATQVFEMVDQNHDGYLHYEETHLLAKLSEDYDLTTDAYDEICNMVGAEADQGLSQEHVVKMYTHLKIGNATADLEKLHNSIRQHNVNR
jgi:hypothetical protein